MFAHDNKENINETKEDMNAIVTFPCLADQKENKIPDIIFTEQAKEFFSRACPAPNEGGSGQGLIGIFWLGKNEKGESVFYADLIPAFNKDDGRLMQDKNGVPYKTGEFAYSNEPMGGNSGRNHEQFKKIIADRIKNAIEMNDQQILKQYEGLYTISDKNEIILDDTKLFGFGIFKGDTIYLINQVRGRSANLNPYSVKYNPEYLYIHYFQEDINDSFQGEYFIKRLLPSFLLNKLEEAASSQLPPENSAIFQSIFNSSLTDAIYELEDVWEKIKDDPDQKNRALLETLSKFCSCNSSKLKEITEVIGLIKKNISLLEEDKEKQAKQFSTLLNTASLWNNQSPFINAINNKYMAVVDLFINDMSSDDLSHCLQYAIQNNKTEVVRLISEKIDIHKEDIDITELALNGKFDMVTLLKNQGVQPKDESTFNDALSLGMIKIAKHNDFHAIKKALSDFPTLDLNKENEDKETFEKTLQTFFILCINERLNKQIINLQEILPDYFKKFAQLPEVLTATINTGFIDALNLIIKNRNFKDDKIDINSLITECTVNNLLYLLKVEKYEEIQEILQKNPDLITRLNENKKSLQSELFEIFLTCIIDENIETLEKIKQSFPDSYHLFLHDNSILFIAIKENKESSLKFLLEEKADPNIKNADNQTPLLYAVSFLNMEMIEILKEYVNDDPSIEYYRQLEQTLLLLIEENKFHEIKSLCDKYKIDIRNTGAMELDRQLWKAASLTVDNAKQILNLFPDAELIDQRWGRLQETLLLLFASENSLEAVQFLLEKKADKELTDNFNYSPLKVAITYRNIQMAGLFASQDNRLDTCEDLIVNCLKFDEYDKIPEIKHYFLSEANQIFENQSADLLSMAVKEEDFAIAFEKVLCLVKNGVNINHLNLNETEIKAEEIQKIYKMKCLLPLEEKDLNHITQRHLALKHIYEEIPVDSFDTAVNNFKELDRLLIELNSFQNMKELEDLIPNCYDEYTKNPDQIQKITKHLLERLIEINNKLPEPKQNNLIFFADPMDNLKQSLTNLINKIEIEISKNLNQRYS